MEKKGTRAVQASCKGAASDSKKAQDVNNGKLWPRGGGRRREPSSGNFTPSKNEPARKNLPTRFNKTFDKRPKPRGFGNFNSNNNGAVVRTETTRLVEQYDAELGSVFLPGSKKQSLNHLLNFVYTPIGEENRIKDRVADGNRLLPKKPKYNKEQFLQANCQFIVNSSGDYRQYMINADALVEWELIEQVNIQVMEFPSCPICLYPPVAGKLTRCGHIYCWSCILHYLSLSDKSWRKCPICYESIHPSDLKSVVSIPHKTFNVNDIITFKLMKRAKGCLTAYPANIEMENYEKIFNVCEKEANNIYSKLLLANNEDILSIIKRERKELKALIDENNSCPENCFVEEALILLNEREDIVMKNVKKTIKLNNSTEDDILLNDKFDELLLNEKNFIDNDNNYQISENDQEKIKFYYFYQAMDGQHIYLNSVNVKMLEHTYGSLEFAPNILTGRILEKEGGSMTEELRRRLRYLQHLPVTCQFEVVEIQLKPPLISKETIELFIEQLELRRKRRQRRAKEEKKREKRIADEENRLMGHHPLPNLHLESYLQFPDVDTANRTESISENSSNSQDGTPSNSLTKYNDYHGLSFAKMLATTSSSTKKKSQSGEWPILKETPASSLSPSNLINVTGSNMFANIVKAHNPTNEDSDCGIEDMLEVASPPPCNRKLGDEIFKALQKAEETEVLDGVSNGKKKKKKNRQKVLFTTSLAFPEK